MEIISLQLKSTNALLENMYLQIHLTLLASSQIQTAVFYLLKSSPFHILRIRLRSEENKDSKILKIIPRLLNLIPE